MPVELIGLGTSPIELIGSGAPMEVLATTSSMEKKVRRWLIGPSASPTVYIKRITSPNDHYDLWQQAGVGSDGNPYFWRLTMWRPATMPGDPANISLRIGHNAIERPLLSGVPGPTLTPATPGIVMSTVAVISNVNPDLSGVGTSWENGGPGFKQPGGTAGFVGASHGYENETAFQLTIDDTPTTMTNGQVIAAESVVFTKTCELFHPNVYSGAVVASDYTNYTWHQQGYDIVRSTTWLADLQFTASYQAMMSTGGVDPETTDRYSNNGVDPPVDYSMTANNDVAKGMAIADLAWIWKDGGGVVASVDYYNPENHAAACNNHLRAGPYYTWIDDRSGSSPPKINKLYSMRIATLSPPLEEATNGTVWGPYSWRYRIGWKSNTAALSRGL